MTLGLQSGIYAKGDIKRYQMAICLVQLLLLPISLLLIHLGFPVYLMVSAFIIVEVLLLCMRLYFAQKIIDLSIFLFIKKIIAPSITSFILCYLLTALVANSFVANIWSLAMVCISSFFTLSLLFWFITINREEKNIVSAMINEIRIKFKRQ